MKYSHVFSVFFVSSVLSACASQDNSPSVLISPNSSGWAITQVQVSQDENKTVISANLRPKSSMARAYVQAKAFDKDGALLATSECKRTPTHFRHANRRQQVVSGGYSQITFPLLQSDAKFNLGVFSDKSCTPQTT